MKVYDYDKNCIKLRTKNRLSYDLDLRGNITIIDGESGSGKTLLVENISRLKCNSSAITGFDVSDIIVVRDPNFSVVDSKVLYIIDHGDRILTDTICESICKCIFTRFLIFARGSYNLGVSPNHLGNFVKEDNTIKISYDFNERWW